MFYYTSTALGQDRPIVIYAGRDKFENDELLKYRRTDDSTVWFHVDKHSSPHVYLDIRPDSGFTWDSVPEALCQDIGQLLKAGSVVGNKLDNVQILVTPTSNLKKDGSMDVGSVSFVRDQKVRRFRVKTRENAIVNRLLKTKVDKTVDHEQERLNREIEEGRRRRAQANAIKNAELETQRQRKAEAAAKDYNTLFEKKGTAEEEDYDWEARQKEGDFDPEDDFM